MWLLLAEEDLTGWPLVVLVLGLALLGVLTVLVCEYYGKKDR